MNPEANPPEMPPDPKFPYDIELIQRKIAKIFNVSIDRTRDIFTIVYGKDLQAKTGGRFKYEILTDVEYQGQRFDKIMVITRESSGYQIALAPTTYKQVVPGTDDFIEIPDVRVIQKFRFPSRPIVKDRPRFKRRNKK